jgi:cytochrome c peroxidase
MVPPFVQPRAVVYRRRTDTLLVASEGTNNLVELDALSIDPSTNPLGTYTACGAPTGIALSEDEASAHVFCRSTHEIVEIALAAYDGKDRKAATVRPIRLASDPLPAKAARGRELFFDAYDSFMSDGFACSGCHPEGRDDGHVWHEDERQYGEGKVTSTSLHAFEMNVREDGFLRGAPRQTPMLAGRVKSTGPYGWKARSPSLRHRVLTGFGLHRWIGGGGSAEETIPRAEALVEFVRTGLVPPPREERPLDKQEERGRELFHHENVGCAACHLPKNEYTHRALVGLGDWAIDQRRFDKELEDARFRTPSLLYVGGTAPYYHDGSMPTLEALIDTNGTRMGHTKDLSPDDRKALVAFLKTL